ncbi:MAG: tetratricopeptide repeat protein [Waterburya sp.]
MFKLFQNLLSSEVDRKQKAIVKSSVSSWEAQMIQADVLWKQGKLTEALAIYDLVIEQNPNLPEIKQRLVGRIKQQGDLAIAYERLASGLKERGEVEQAANYYRQAINLKALSGNTRNQLLRSSVVSVEKLPIPLANLKEAAVSFQPLTNNSAIARVPAAPMTIPKLEAEFNPEPQFLPRIKAVNPQQARQIDWETAQVYFQKALEHLEKQEWEQSALACKQATQIMPDMAEAYKIWGNSLQRMGKTGEAMACYAKAVEVKPNLAEVYSGIAGIYAQQSKWEQAIKHYQKAIIIKPSVQDYRKLAAIWQNLGEIEKAEFSLYQATELELAEIAPNSLIATDQKSLDSELAAVDHSNIEDAVAIYCRAAKQLEQKNQWQQAAKYYRQAIDLSMSRLAIAPAKNNPSENQLEPTKTPEAQIPINQLDKAIRRYHKQAKLQPNSPKIYTDLGNLYAKKSSFPEAIACYRKAIKLNRKYPNAHLCLARILLKAKKSVEFVKEMQLALALQPNIGTAMDRFHLADALVEQHQEQQAIGFYYKAIVLDPTFSASYHRLSEILSHQGKHDEAIEFLERGIQRNPQDPELYYLLAHQWEQLENWDNAVKTYSRVLEIEPKYPEASKKLNHALAQKLKFKSDKVTK